MKALTNYITDIRRKANDSSLAKRLISGVSWTLVGNIVGKFMQLLAFIFVARIIGKEQYGQLSIVRSTLMMFLVFSSAGMGITATRYIAMYRISNPKLAYEIYRFTLKFVIWIGLAISVLVYLFSSVIAEKQLHSPQLADVIKLGAAALFMLTLTSVQTGSLNGFEKFKELGKNTAYNGLVQFTCILLGAYFWGIFGAIAGIGIAALIFFFQLQIQLRNEVRKIKSIKEINVDEKLNKSSIFFKFSLPAILQALVFIPVLWWSKTYLIGNSNYGEMAIYDVAEQWYHVVLFIPTSLSTIILPLLTNTSYNGSEGQYNKLLKVNLLLNVGVAFSIALVVALFSPIIYKFYGDGFTDYKPLLILLITVVLSAVNNVFGQVIASKGKMWIGFAVNLLWAIWLILFSVIFIGKYQLGALGLAYALMFSYLLHSMLQGYIALKIKI